MSSNPLVDLGSLAKPAEILVERFCDGVGGVFHPWQIRRIAKAEAEAEVIRAKAEIEKQKIIGAAELAKTEVGQRAIARLIETEVRNQINMEAILSEAIKALETNSKPEEISNTFINDAFERCKSVSEAELQQLWGRIIASEANRPNSVPRTALEVLARMDTNDAKLFSLFSTCCLGIPQAGAEPSVYPFLTNSVTSILSELGIKFEAIKHLEALGLIQTSELGHSFTATARDPSTETTISLGRNSDWAYITFDPHVEIKLEFGSAILTKAGRRIVELGSEPNNMDVFSAALDDQMASGRWIAVHLKPTE